MWTPELLSAVIFRKRHSDAAKPLTLNSPPGMLLAFINNTLDPISTQLAPRKSLFAHELHTCFQSQSYHSSTKRRDYIFACILSNPERGLRAEVTEFNSSQCWLNPMISFIEEQLESWEEKPVSEARHLCMCTLERHVFISRTSVLMCIWLVGCYWPVSKENKKCHLPTAVANVHLFVLWFLCARTSFINVYNDILNGEQEFKTLILFIVLYSFKISWIYCMFPMFSLGSI